MWFKSTSIWFILIICGFPEFEHCQFLIHFLQMPRQLGKLQAFPEMPRDFRKCLISAIPCDIYTFVICKHIFDYAYNGGNL
jgi:hypothetical protein